MPFSSFTPPLVSRGTGPLFRVNRSPIFLPHVLKKDDSKPEQLFMFYSKPAWIYQVPTIQNNTYKRNSFRGMEFL